MEHENSRPAWMSDELVKDIPQKKLDFSVSFGKKLCGKV